MLLMTRWLREARGSRRVLYIFWGSVVLLYNVIWGKRGVKNGHLLVI